MKYYLLYFVALYLMSHAVSKMLDFEYDAGASDLEAEKLKAWENGFTRGVSAGK